MGFPVENNQFDFNFNINKLLRILIELFKNRETSKSIPTKEDYLLWHHVFACESHRQMMSTALGILGGEIEDIRTEETKRLVNEMMQS